MKHELQKNFMAEVKIAVEKPRFPLTLTLSSSD